MPIPKTFGQIKHGLMQHGVFIPPNLLNQNDIAKALLLNDSRNQITFAFCEDFFVKTFPTKDEKSSCKIFLDNGSFILQSERMMVGVDVICPPKFLCERLRNRDPVAHNIDLDGNCLNLFLRILKNSKLNMSLENVTNIIQSAFEEGVADLIQLNLDFYDSNDRGFSKLVPIIQDIRKKFRTFIGLRGFPPKDLRVIDSIYASGVDLLNFPLEGFARSEKLKSFYTQVFGGLEYAASVFPKGAVCTELTAAPVNSLNDKIDSLIARGIIPKIKLPKGVRKDMTRFTSILEIAHQLTQSTLKEKLNLKWLYPTAEFLTPLDAAFFIDDPKKANLAARPHYNSILGRKTTEGFTALRRKLRVKNISDSYESAGL